MTNLFIYLFNQGKGGGGISNLHLTNDHWIFGFSPKGPLVQSLAPLSTGPEQIGSQYVNSEPKQFNTILSTQGACKECVIGVYGLGLKCHNRVMVQPS